MAEGNGSIPVGFCQCGCGGRTKPAKVTRTERGNVRGQPLPFLQHHNAKSRPVNEAKQKGLLYCWRCRLAKPPACFYRGRVASGRPGVCKECNREMQAEWRVANPEQSLRMCRKANLRSKYGLSPAQYAQMFESQGGLCAICGRPETRKTRAGDLWMLHVDHDHTTGTIRGLLCHYCNTAIGALREDEAILLKAIEYLRKHK